MMPRLLVFSQLPVKFLRGGFFTRELTSKLLFGCHWTSLRTTHVLSPSTLENRNTIYCEILRNGNSCSNNYFLQPRRHAGHAKWQNIQHIKKAKDAQKQFTTERVLRHVRIAIKEGGGTNPDFNPQLRRALERAKMSNVPKTTVMNTLKTTEKNASQGKQCIIDCRGPFGSAIIVEAHTVKASRIRNEVQHVLKKYGGTSINVTGVKHSFEHKALIEACAAEGQKDITLEKAEEIAIDVEAEDVNVSSDETDSRSVYQFICDIKEFSTVKKNLTEKGLEIVSGYLGYVPVSLVDTPPENIEAISDMINKLEALEDVVRVYDNFKIPS